MNSNLRYSRQTQLTEVGKKGQQKLSNARVLIVGVGGLGCPSAQYLVAAGVGKVGLLDKDIIDETNLHRQILFRESDVGMPKSETAKLVLKKHNSDIEIISYQEALTTQNALKLFSEYDLIIDGTDNFQTKYLINDACIKSNKPWIYASVYKYQGQLSVFNFEGGPSYRCLFPKIPRQELNCEEAGVLGVLPGILGTLQATEALKIILGLGDVLSGTLKIIDSLTMKEQMITFRRNHDRIDEIINQNLHLEELSCEISESRRIYLDVRELHEQPQPTNQNIVKIPLSQLRDRYNELPRNEAIHVYCQSGKRSIKAIEILEQEFAFQNLVNVQGGMKTILK